MTVAEIAVYAGAPDLDHAVAQVLQAGQVEFGLRVVAADLLRLAGREDAVGAHHPVFVAFAHQQVVAIFVENVAVQAFFCADEVRAHFLGEYLVTQALRLQHFRLGAGEARGQAPRGGMIGLSVEFQHCDSSLVDDGRSLEGACCNAMTRM